MRKSLALALAALLVACFVSYSFAYEIELKGQYENRFRWWERTGNLDLFGNAAAQDSPLNAGASITPIAAPHHVGFAGPNIYGRGGTAAGYTATGSNKPTSNLLTNLGGGGGAFGAIAASQMAIVRGGFSHSSSSAFVNDSRMTLEPTIRVNPAVRLHGVYNIGGYRNKYNMTNNGVGIAPLERYYQSQSSMNANDTGAIGSWEQFRATVNIPWGTLSIGLKDFPLGTGATLGYNTRAESALLVVPYGPMRFLGAAWLGRSRGNEAWNSAPDGSEKNDVFAGMIMTYDDGPLSAGLGYIYRNFHGNTQPGGNNLRDDLTQIYIAYFKYFNGRFFANAEYSWVTDDRNRTTLAPLADGTGGTLTYGTGSSSFDLQCYHLFTEMGTVVGPMKLSLVYALASGPVLNTANRLRNLYGGAVTAGEMATNPRMAPGANPKIYTPFAVNYQAMEPYEYLMFNTYAGGNNGGWNILDISFVQDDHGMMTDAYAFAGRVDYAVASNLNIWASYIWAHRLERFGTYLGQYTSQGALCGNTTVEVGGNAAAFYANAGRIAGIGADYVSDGYLGWEVNGGVDWKLLEGMTFKGRYSRWEPGPWFKEAYQSLVLVSGGGVTRWGVQNSRDAIQSFQGSLLIEF